MVIDTSAILAIILGEPEHKSLNEVIGDAELCLLSAASYLESSVVVEKKTGSMGLHLFDQLLRIGDITIAPVTISQADIARSAYSKFGKGNHKAGLNFGDCFPYALSRETGEPLLFKGSDFAETDVSVVQY